MSGASAPDGAFDDARPERRGGLPSRAEDRRVFRSARMVLAGRNGRPSIADIAYLAYAGGLAVLIAGAPLVRLAVLGLIEPDAFAAIGADVFGVGASIVAGLAVLVVVLGGAVRGPVVPRPSAVQFLADSPLPRRLTLRRPFLFSVAGLVIVVFIIGGIVALSRLIGVSGGSASGQAPPETVSAGSDLGSAMVVGIAAGPGGAVSPDVVIAFLLGVIAFAAFLAVVWLSAQRRLRPVVWALGGAVVVTSALALVAPVVLLFTPWGWVGLLWSQLIGGIGGRLALGASGFWGAGGGEFAFVAGTTIWSPAIALVLVAFTVLAVPRLLDGLRSAELLEQSRRWQSVAMLVQTGDAAGAAGHLRPPPRRGRRIPMAMPASLALAAIVRSVVGLLRYPARGITGSAVLVVCGIVVASSANAAAGVGWVLVVPAGLVVFLAVGVWCDGIRQGVASAGAPTLYGRPPSELVVVASIAPLIAAVVFGGVGAGIAVAAFGAPIQALGWWCALAVFSVVLRVFDAAKGPLPIGLMMPIPTPLGDVSYINVLLWQSDAVLLAVVVGGGLSAFASSLGVVAYVWLAVATVLVGLIAAYRLRKLSAQD